jgi:aminoglycoside phosphotransferase (APT) family kinase protein
VGAHSGKQRSEVEALPAQVAEASSHFEIAGDLVSATRYGTGHINESYLVTFDQEGARLRFLLQRLNTNVFRDAPALMENVLRVTSHLRARLIAAGASDVSRRTLTVVPSRDGRSYHRGADGGFWRAYDFIEGTRTYDVVESPEVAREAARAFARFQRNLVDLPGVRLHETIADFHHSPRRFEAFEAAVAADSHRRAAGAAAEVRHAFEARARVERLVELAKSGQVPERVTHNDTKVNNVLFDAVSAGAGSPEAICITDLDTVMPGLVLYDFGDLVRTAATTAAEDERDLSRVRLAPEMFRALARGYIEEAGDFLTRAERDHLVFSAWLMTFEVALRFLTDHLQGDVYFRIHRPGHNLDRARAQFRLAQSIREAEGELEAWVRAM